MPFLTAFFAPVQEFRIGTTQPNQGQQNIVPDNHVILYFLISYIFLFQLNNRAMNNLDKKKRLVKAFKKGITPEGQRVFHAISKT